MSGAYATVNVRLLVCLFLAHKLDIYTIQYCCIRSSRDRLCFYAEIKIIFGAVYIYSVASAPAMIGLVLLRRFRLFVGTVWTVTDSGRH